MDVLGSELHALREDGFEIEDIGFDVGDFDFETPDFQPGSEDEQGQLDEKKKTVCPECKYEFEA